MDGALIHGVFDVAAWLSAAASLWWLTQRIQFPAAPVADLGYIAALLFGAGLGAFAFGTVNLWLSQQTGFARSIEGALAGAILAVELFKRAGGVRVRTGARFALPLVVGVAVGRVGCFLAGLDDFTYGTPTILPWGHDFGDGLRRHPVQLYEAAAMAAFALLYVRRALRGDRFVIENGLYLAVAWYGVQRFLWEFLKPYGTLLGPLTLFHLLSVALIIYAAAMIATAPARRPADDRAPA